MLECLQRIKAITVTIKADLSGLVMNDLKDSVRSLIQP